jgi:hypothetical protein
VTGTVGELGGLALSVVVLVVREEDTLNREATRCDHQLATAAVARKGSQGICMHWGLFTTSGSELLRRHG